jgi:hypothetical protein
VPAPTVSRATFHDGRILRGTSKHTTATGTFGSIRGENICTKASDEDIRADIAARGHWVIVHGKAGKICWTGRITSVQIEGPVQMWSFEVYNTLNLADDDPGSGDETVTVTVVSPDNGPSNPLQTATNVVSVP